MRVWAVCAVALVGCGGRVVVDHEADEGVAGVGWNAGCVEADDCDERCEPASWAAHEGSPLAGVGKEAPFTFPEVLIARLGPFDEDATIAELDIGAAPGWGCDMPPEVPVGAWLGTKPAGNPLGKLKLAPVLAEADLGNGFTARRVTLPEPLDVPAGATVLVAFALTTPASCGAKAQGPAVGLAWRWREDVGWSELDGRLVVWARVCNE